jgi:hypothetical protein
MSQRLLFEQLTLDHKDQWEQLLRNCQYSTPFHSIEWNRVLRLSFQDENPIYLGLWQNHELIGVWPTSVLEVLAGKILSPLHLHADYFATTPAVRMGVEMSSLHQLVSDIMHLMNRQHHILSWSLRIPRNRPFIEIARYCGFEVESSDSLPAIVLHTQTNPESFWEKCPHGGLRTCVRKAERNGLEVRESTDSSDLREYFYAKYPQAYYEPTPELLRELSFWVRIHQLVMDRGKAKLFVTINQDRIIGGAIVFFEDNRAYLWNMGSLERTWSMHPNHILVWNLINWAYDSGIESIDFGSGTAGSNYFVRRNLTDYELVNQAVLTLPVSKFRHKLQYGLVRTYRKHSLWVPSALAKWYCRSIMGPT